MWSLTRYLLVSPTSLLTSRIQQGDDIDPNKPIISSFSQKIEKGSSIRHWDSVVVISHSEVDFLPVSMRDCESAHPDCYAVDHEKR